MSGSSGARGTLAIFVLMSLVTGAWAQTGKRNSDVEKQSTFVFENDLFTFDDGGYTNGFGYYWQYGPFRSFEDRTPAWLEWLTGNLYIATMPGKERRVSYGIAQEIYTPEEIVFEEADPNDRPYAGLLLWQASWMAYDERTVDRLELELGMVGSVALGEQTQKLVHDLTGANEPEGWDDQLENEPVFRIGAARSWRLHAGSIGGLEVDVLGHGFGSAGTRRSEVGTGLSLRVGNGLGRSLVNATLNPARGVNPIAGRPREWYAFVGLGGGYVFNDITLNGNTFEDSPSVNIEHWQASASVGIAMSLGNWGWLFSTRWVSDEFETQLKESRYGALSLSYRFSER